MQRYYKGFKHDRQRQIDNLLSVYTFLGQKNHKKPIPTTPKRGEPDARTRKTNLPKG